MKFIGSSKVTRQGQVSIPADIRRKLAISTGDYIVFVEDKNGRIFITKEISLPPK